MNERFYVFVPGKSVFWNRCGKKVISKELGKYGKQVMLTYGGGSVIDCRKIISAQAMTEKDIWEMEFEEHVYPTKFVPMGAVVTAAGTGAEMNNGAVITNEEKKIKTGVLSAFCRDSLGRIRGRKDQRGSSPCRNRGPCRFYQRGWAADKLCSVGCGAG